MNKVYSISVRGKDKEWSFHFYGDPQHLPEWREDGLEIHEVVNMVPVWVVRLGCVRAWCFFQDIFNFKNPFAKD